jgi:hypothetical protein
VDGVVLINQSTVVAAGFPYVISQAGSYKLSGNLQVPTGVNGIQITASNVALDLNGFSITNADPSASTTLVRTVGAVQSVTVRNGTISCVSQALGSIPIDTAVASGTVLEDLSLLTSSGGVAFGSSVIVRRVSFPSGAVFITCPALVVDSLAQQFIRNQASSTACAFGFVSGNVI